MNKTLFKCAMIFSLFQCTLIFCQEIQKIIPPSPNAYGFHTYGNLQTNHYTGSTDITIPIWEIKEGGITIPIYLKYSGDNGIKVEEIASWVGLGWTLNTGGAISRTIRGLADEDQTKVGYLGMTEIPIPDESNSFLLNQIENGLADGEPDKYWYNTPHASGSFFFDLNGNVQIKPKKNILVSYQIGVENESVSSPEVLTYDGVIKGFSIIDEYGNSYEFNDKERSSARPANGTSSDPRGFPSTWYLSKVKDMNQKDSVLFDYDAYVYSIRTRKPVQRHAPGMVEDDFFMDTFYIGKRLDQISYSLGSLEFLESTQDRADLPGNKYLEGIIVRDLHGTVIKNIRFEYQYMTPSGIVEESNIGSYGSHELRLMLKSMKECDASNACEPGTDFSYEGNVSLPSRHSYAQDHWGYYNGATSNTTLEPRQIVKWYNPTVSDWIITQSGSANRNAVANFSKAGILKTIKYPYGGETIIEYEGHTALNNELERPTNLQSLGLMWKNTEYQFDIDLYSRDYTELTSSALYTDPTNSACEPKIYIQNLTTNEMDILVLDENNTEGFSNKVLLESGSYKAWFVLESDIIGTCTQPDPAAIILKWEDEDSNPTIPIGGVRVKSVSNYTSDAQLSSKKYYNYNDSTGLTTGRLVNIPRYYGITYIYMDYSTSTILPVNYETFVASSVPLANTQGSSVGYGKVSVYEENLENGLQEFYYSTSDDTPDIYNGIYPVTGDSHYYYFQGKKIYPYPPPEIDSRDFLRGILKKHKIYRKEGGNLILTYEVSKEWDTLTYAIGDMASIDNHIVNEARIGRGLKMYSYPGGGSDYTYYDLFSGYALDWKTTEHSYYDGSMVEKEKIFDYERDSYGLIHQYLPTTIITLDSRQIPRVKKTTYLFNKEGTSSEENELIEFV